MIVCLCRGVSDRAVRAVIRAGAETEDEVGELCGAGTCCGGCQPTITELIDEERKSHRVRLSVLVEMPASG